jgi:hypothetical protein
VKKGDLVTLKNLHPSWGDIGIIMNIRITNFGTGQISLMTNKLTNCSVPWLKRCMYIDEVISENG